MMINKFLQYPLNFLKDIVSPPYCQGCRAWLEMRTIFCTLCEDKLQPIVSYQLEITATKKVSVIALSNYAFPIRNLILAKNRKHVLSAYNLGKLIAQKTVIKDLDVDIIVPVPLHWTRFLKRGYNQAELIAQEIAQAKGIPVVNLLKRKKRTQLQALLKKDEREDNLKDAFVLKKNYSKYKDKKILVVDDLMTTGSTLKYACKEIFKAQPKDLLCVVSARVI